MSGLQSLLYITASYPWGGGESFLRPELAELRRSGVAVRVCPTYPRGARRSDAVGDDIPPADWLPLISWRYIVCFLLDILSSPNVTFKILLLLSKSPKKFLKNFLLALKAGYLARRVLKDKYSHIHAHWGGTSSTMAMIVSLRTGIPWSFTCHRWDIYENNLLTEKSRSAKFTRFISRKGLRDAVGMGVLPDRALIIPMGIDLPSQVNLPEVGDPPLIVCAANLIEVKGITYLLHALHIVKSSGYCFRLEVYGEGPLKERLVTEAEAYGLDGMVFFRGAIPHSQLMELYRSGVVDLVVLPSIHLGEGNHEGVPVSLMEAMAYAIPVISTKTGSISELLPDRLNLTVDGGDSQALAGKIIELISDDDFYIRSSRLVRDVVSRCWGIRIVVAELKIKMSC